MSSSTDNILELGKELASVMEDWDVLGRWMAHYVAELIVAADEASDKAEAAAAKARAAQEIRLLWSHRAAMRRPYPLENFDRVLATLDRLDDPAARGPLSRYFGDDAPSESDLTLAPLLQVAAHLDDESTRVITYLIAEAAATAENREARWLPVAMEMQADQQELALRRLMLIMRRRRLTSQGQQSTVETHPGAKVSADDADDAPVDEASENELTPGQGDQDDTAVRTEALVEAIDQASATLSRLRSALTETAT